MKKTTNPTTHELRQFGLMFGAFAAGIFGLLIPLLLDRPSPLWPWVTAAMMGSLALVVPVSLLWVHRAWMKFGAVAGWVNTRIILLLLFYLVITPTGLLMRLLGKDLLHKRFNASCESYRCSHPAQPKEHMEKPY